MNMPKLPRGRRKKARHAAPGTAKRGRVGSGGGRHRAAATEPYEGRHRAASHKGRHRADDEDRYVRPTPVKTGHHRLTPADDRPRRASMSAHYRSTNR